jgi:hypothetical protein
VKINHPVQKKYSLTHTNFLKKKIGAQARLALFPLPSIIRERERKKKRKKARGRGNTLVHTHSKKKKWDFSFWERVQES